MKKSNEVCYRLTRSLETVWVIVSLSLLERRLNATIRQRIEHHVAQVALIRRGCIRCDQAVLTARDKLQQKRDTLLEQLNITNLFRKKRIQILSQHIFRLEHVSMIEE